MESQVINEDHQKVKKELISKVTFMKEEIKLKEKEKHDELERLRHAFNEEKG